MHNDVDGLNLASDREALGPDEVELPVIDLGPLHGADGERRRKVAAELGHAAKTTGFFYITNHGVPDNVVKGVLEASKEFHGLTRSEKMKYWCGFSTNHRGYVPFEENDASFPKRINMLDAFDLSYESPADHPDYVAGWRMTGPNVWPELAGWREKVSAYYNAIFELGLKLLDTLAHELGVEASELRRFINHPTSQLRLLRYLPNELTERTDTIGIVEHSDYECFTILLQCERGLQVMNLDDHWVEAPPLPGTFIVNIGDIFQAWSGGRFKSTQHRVLNTGRERYSFPLFFGLDYHAVVEPLEKFRTPENIKTYPPMKAGHHLMRMTAGAFRYMADAKDKGVFQLDGEELVENPFHRDAKAIARSSKVSATLGD